MQKLSIKAVLIGGIADVVSSGVLGFPLVMYVMTSRGLSHLPPDQMQAATVAAVHSSIGLYAIQLLIGLGCSVMGGYIAARIAKHDELLNGVVASWLCVAIGIYSLVAGRSPTPVLPAFLLIALTPGCYWVGAYLRLRKARATPTGI